MGNAQTFNGQGGLLVPPGAPGQTVGITQSIATVSGMGIIGDGCTMIDHITMDLEHTFVGDIALFLIAPSGEVLELSSGNGGGGNNFQVTTFTDNTALFITQGAPPYNGSFRPEGRQLNLAPPFFNTNPLGTYTFATQFNGVVADGDWVLYINDYVAIDVGILNSWSITFTTGPGPAPEVSLGPDITICPGTPTTLVANVNPSADTYLWSTGSGASSISVSPNVNTTYSVTVTNNGCTDADTIQVFVNATGVNANAGPDVSICQGIGTTLTGSGGSASSTYNWSTGQSGTSISVNPASTTTYTLTITDGGCTGTDQVMVTVTPMPTANAGPDVEICDDQSATLTATGGTQNNQYTWSTGQNGATITVSPNITTTYTVTVSINGCTDTDVVEVTVNPLPSVDAGPNVQICQGESADLSADGTGGTYLWNTGQSGPDITVSPVITTTYTVTVTDNGCTASDQVTVTVGNINAGITPDTEICAGESISLTATGGTSYEWSTGAGSATINVTPGITTTYTVTVTQGSCTDEASVEITVNPIPIATVSPDEEICAGTNVSLTASGGSTYQWSSGQNTSTINVSPPATTNYVVTVTDAGCSSTTSVQVLVNPTPNANAGTDESICDGESATLVATGLSGSGSYEWSTGESGASIIVTPLNTTTYTVTITNQWDCTDTDFVTVTVNAIPDASAGPDIDLCSGNVATLIATGGTTPATYLWSNGQNGSSITVSPNNNTTYTVTVTIAGCSDDDETEVFVLPSPTANAGADEDICEGSSVELTATGGGSYVWSSGQTVETIDINPNITTTYSVTVTNSDGCTDQDDVTVVVNPLPQADAGPDQSICEGESVSLNASGGGTYEWSTGENTQTIDVAPGGTTSYQLTVTDDNGCTSIDITTVIVNPIPFANAGTNIFIITGESATLSATGGGSYLWSTGETTNQIIVAPGVTTIYSVTVTVNGCTDVDEVTVFVNEAPSVDLGPDIIICEGETATLIASVPGPFTLEYTWSSGETTGSINVSPLITTSYSVTATDITSGLTSIDTMIVTVLNLPIGIPVITGSTVLCDGDISTYTVNTLTGATSYDWSVPAGATITSGQNTTAIEVNWGTANGGPVQLIVSNSCGSIPTTFFDVFINTVPVIPGPVNGQTDPCADGSSSYSVPMISGADAYQWSVAGGGVITTGQGTNNIVIEWNGSSGGDVCVAASNECGTSTSVCLPVVTTTTPSIDAGIDQELCGLTATLAASGFGSWTVISGPGSPQFSDINNPTATVDVSNSGTYTLSFAISQNGCAAEDTVAVTFNDAPVIINQLTDCNNINSAYTVSFEIAGGTSPFTVDGNVLPGSDFTSSLIPAGDTYAYQVIDANGCTSQVISGLILCNCTSEAGTMNVTPLVACVGTTVSASYNGDAVIDGNDIVAFILHDGNIPGGIISWNTIPEFQFVPGMLASTTYFISAVTGDEGPGGLPQINDPCLAVSPGTPVTFYKDPVAVAGADQVLGCTAPGVTLRAVGSSIGPTFEYFWSTINGLLDGSPDSADITALSDGTYILKVTQNIAGCVALDTVTVTQHELDIDQLLLTGAPPLCVDDCNGIITILNSPMSFLFDFGDGNFSSDTSYNLACSGIHTIMIMDTLGCTRDTNITLPSPTELTVSLGPDVTILPGDSVTLNAQSDQAITNFNWPGASTCIACPQIIVSPLSTTTYIVVVTDDNQCTASDELLVTVETIKEEIDNIYVPTVFSPNGDGINDRFVIDAGKGFTTIQHLEIFDRWGSKIFDVKDFSPSDLNTSWDGSFRNALVNPGVYVYKLNAVSDSGTPIHLSGDLTLLR